MLQRSPVSKVLYPCRPLQAASRSKSTGLGETRSRDKGVLPDRLRRTAYIRPQRLLSSPAEAFAVIRGVERKYGAINEFRFLKDYDVATKYQAIILVAFRDESAYLRVSPKPEEMSIELPPTAAQPGGIGLDDIEPLTAPQEFEEKVEEFPDFGRVMNTVLEDAKNVTQRISKMELKIQVERADSELVSAHPSTARPYRDDPLQIARKFVEWGGFNQLRAAPVDIENHDPSSPPVDVGHSLMRHALQKHCDLLHIPNPYEALPVSETSPRPIQILEEPQTVIPEWKPLPGHEATPEDTPMLSTVLAASEQQLNKPATTTSPPIPATDVPVSNVVMLAPELQTNEPIPSASDAYFLPEALNPVIATSTSAPSSSSTHKPKIIPTPPQKKKGSPPKQVSPNSKTHQAPTSSASKPQSNQNKKPHPPQKQQKAASKQTPAKRKGRNIEGDALLKAMKLRNTKPSDAQTSSPEKPAQPEKPTGGIQQKLKNLFSGWI